MVNLLNLKYMKAQYDFLTVPSTKKGSRAVIYPKLVSGGTVSFMELAEQIDRASGFQKGTVIGVVEEIERWAQHYLQHGRRVRIGNLVHCRLGSRPFVRWRMRLHPCTVCMLREGPFYGIPKIPLSRNAGACRGFPQIQGEFTPADGGGALRPADGLPGFACLYYPYPLYRTDGSLAYAGSERTEPVAGRG